MNGLMWFIYLANVLPKLAIFGVLLCFAAVILILLLPPKGVRIFSYDHTGPLCGLTRKEPWIMLIVGVFLALVTPNKETIYLMAGAKGAEVAVESEAGQEILDDIQQVIKHQLGELKGVAGQ